MMHRGESFKLKQINEKKPQLNNETTSSPKQEVKVPRSNASNNNQIMDPHSGAPERAFDVIVFAASGSVGQFVIEELALVVDKHYPKSPKHKLARTRRESVPSSKQNSAGVKWALAGRSAMRLNETLCRAELSTGIPNLSQNVALVLADLNKHDSLVNMCKQTHLIINCAGPYSELGAELLIRAALECRTNYLDLCHETKFIELMRQKYSEPAKEAGVFIIQSCGFQSMSSELGLNFTKQVVDGQIERVKIILDLNDTKSNAATSSRCPLSSVGIVSPGMWQSLLADKSQEAAPRVRPATLDKNCATSADENAPKAHHLQRKDTQTLVRDIVEFNNRNSTSFWMVMVRNCVLKLVSLVSPRAGSRSMHATSDNLMSATCNTQSGYIWPINSMTSDESQLIRSEMSNYELRGPDSRPSGWRPIQCSHFISLASFSQLCLFCLWLLLFQILANFSLARRLMRAFPRLASVNSVAPYLEGASSSHASASVPARALDRAALSHIKFSQTFLAYGRPSDESGDPLERREEESLRGHQQLLISRVVGPEPNHVATATFIVQGALALLFERDHLPQAGGVLTPGAAFADTNIIHQLRKRNIKFEVLKKA